MTSECDPMYLEYFSSQYKLCSWHICPLQAHLCHLHSPGSLPIFFLSYFYHFRCIWCTGGTSPLPCALSPNCEPIPMLHTQGKCPSSRLAGSAQGSQRATRQMSRPLGLIPLDLKSTSVLTGPQKSTETPALS